MSGSKTNPAYVQVAPQAISRTDVASTRRAFQDLTTQVTRLQNEVARLVASEAFVSQESFQQAWDKRLQLNQLNERIAEVRQQTESFMPQPGGARLTERERNEIKHLYQSGLYTQQKLADQYGVTQPTIGDIVRS